MYQQNCTPCRQAAICNTPTCSIPYLLQAPLGMYRLHWVGALSADRNRQCIGPRRFRAPAFIRDYAFSQSHLVSPYWVSGNQELAFPFPEACPNSLFRTAGIPYVCLSSLCRTLGGTIWSTRSCCYCKSRYVLCSIKYAASDIVAWEAEFWQSTVQSVFVLPNAETVCRSRIKHPITSL